MIAEIKRANEIITEYLSFSKAGNRKLSREDLSSIILNMYPLLQSDDLNSSKRIELDLVPELYLSLSNREIKQLVHNLVRNGLEAMEEHGALTIRTFVEGEYIVLAIKDQGQGMPEEVLEKLGTPFFTTKEKGSGLGLAVCYKIASNHNGEIQVKTDATGTVFYVRFKTK